MNVHELNRMLDSMVEEMKRQPLMALAHIAPLMDWLEENDVCGAASLRLTLTDSAADWLSQLNSFVTEMTLRHMDPKCACCRQNPKMDGDHLCRCHGCAVRQMQPHRFRGNVRWRANR